MYFEYLYFACIILILIFDYFEYLKKKNIKKLNLKPKWKKNILLISKEKYPKK